MAPYFSRQGARENSVVSLGRFAEDKGQLEIIKLAEDLPQIRFHIIGFSQKPDYLNRCKDYINSHQLENVDLHVNAGFSETISILQRAKIFVHRLINEPFGLSTVQGIAAGCIPIVHDSGGQIETIPFDFLRYRSSDEISGIIETVNAFPEDRVDEIRADLQSHARKHFSEEVFSEKVSLLIRQQLA